DRYLVLWLAVPFVFFSLSQSKRPQYILPLMPAIAMLAARRWEKQRVAAIAMAVLGALILAAIPLVHVPFGTETAVLLGAAALVCGLVAIFTRGTIAVIALSLPMLLVPVSTAGVMRSIAGRRSTQALITALRPYATADVVGIQAFTGSMAFYLQKPI